MAILTLGALNFLSGRAIDAVNVQNPSANVGKTEIESAQVIAVSQGGREAGAVATNSAGNVESLAARRLYLNDKFGRTGDLNRDINYRGVVENIYSNADAAAEFAVGTPRTYGRFGTKAHTEFERLNELTNQRIVGTDYSIVPEQFRGPSVAGGPGLVTTRRAAGSKGVDALVQYRNVPQIGFDLKTGRGWSPSTVTQIQQRFGVPIEQIYTK